MSPIAPLPSGQPPIGSGASFGQLVETAIRDTTRTSDPAWILRSGELDPQLLCRYATGRVSNPERRAVQELVVRHDWARGRVATLVKAGRSDAPALSLGRAVLQGAESGVVDPYRISTAAALRSLEANDAAEAVERGDQEGFAALRLEGLPALLGNVALASDRAAARSKLEAQPSGDEAAAVSLARRIASLDEDEALVELLSAL